MNTDFRNNEDLFVSIVVPVFNEEEVLQEFYERTRTALSTVRFEILFVDDGSKDRSWSLIEELAAKDSRVAGLSFTRNFGHQAALTAGLEYARGNPVVIIDSDLQDPPELIPEMIRRWQEGYDVVYGVRSERKGESRFKKWTATFFYRLLRKISHLDLPLEAGDFRLLSRPVIEALNRIPERVRFLRGLTSWAGYRQTGIHYARDERFAGKTKYPLFRMMKFALDGISSFSSAPLQLATYLGLFATGVSGLYALYSIYIRLFTQTATKGWTSLLIVMVFLGGIQLLMIGIIGEYIGRIYEEVKRRPIYLIRSKTGLHVKRIEKDEPYAVKE